MSEMHLIPLPRLNAAVRVIRGVGLVIVLLKEFVNVFRRPCRLLNLVVQ